MVLKRETQYESRQKAIISKDNSSVADPDPGSGAFLTPGSGMGRK
jgi:hypothetical protein